MTDERVIAFGGRDGLGASRGLDGLFVDVQQMVDGWLQLAFLPDLGRTCGSAAS